MRRLRFSVFAIVLVACTSCDHASKYAAIHLLDPGERVAFAADTIRFELVSNPGAFMSLGAGLPMPVRRALLLVLVPASLTILCVGFLRSVDTSNRTRLALGLVAGGGLGNWIDRWLHDGAVTDFVSVGLGPLRTGIFNVADVAVMLGVGALLIVARREARPPAGAER